MSGCAELRLAFVLLLFYKGMRFKTLFFSMIMLFHFETPAAQVVDHYQVLKVSREASAEEIKKAYRREISRYHPDKFLDVSEDQKEELLTRAKEVNVAYGILGDLDKKEIYDQILESKAKVGFHPANSASPKSSSSQKPPNPIQQVEKNLAGFSVVFKLTKDLSESNKILVALSYLEKRFPFEKSIFVNLPQMSVYVLFVQKLWSEKIFQTKYSNGNLEDMEVMLKASFSYLKQIDAVHTATYQKSFNEGYRYLYGVHVKSQQVNTPHQQDFSDMLGRVLNFAVASHANEWSLQEYYIHLRSQAFMCKALF